jgi:biopolymer transport protein ExbD
MTPAKNDTTSDGGGEQLSAFRQARRRRHKASGVSFAVNIAPMIDVTFLLLIFFLVTTRFERAEGLLASELPAEVGVPAVGLPLSPIVVRLSAEGPESDEVGIRIDKFSGEPANFEELIAYLREIQRRPGFDKDTPVVIVAENDVQWDHVVSCWNAALRADCSRIAFGEP